MLKYASAFALILAAAPAFAQSGATQSPPTPNAAASAPTPATSVPAGALTSNPSTTQNPNVSGALGASSTTGSGPAVTPGTAGAASGAMSNTVPAAPR